MLRFIVLSLAVHGLVIGSWHRLDFQPEAISSAHTIALTLEAHTPAATDSSLQAQSQTGTPQATRTGQQTAVPEPGDRHPVAQRHVPAPAATRQPPARDVSGSTHAAEAATGTHETTSRELAGPAPAADPTPAAADDMPARQALRTAVSTAFRANFRYPRIARRNGWEGTVILALRVLPDGQLSDIIVSSSSGYPTLDRAAVHTLQTASVPQAGQWLNGQACELVIPVEYHLLDS